MLALGAACIGCAQAADGVDNIAAQVGGDPLPMQGNVNAESDHGQVSSQAVDHFPALSRVEGDAEELQYVFGDEDTAEGDADYGDEEECIHDEVEPGLVK